MWNHKNHFASRANLTSRIYNEMLRKERLGESHGFLELSNLLSRMTYRQKNKENLKGSLTKQSGLAFFKKVNRRSLLGVQTRQDSQNKILTFSVSFILSSAITMLTMLLLAMFKPFSINSLVGYEVGVIVFLATLIYLILSTIMTIKSRKSIREYMLYKFVKKGNPKVDWEKVIKTFYRSDPYSLYFSENDIRVETYLITPNIVGARKQYINGLELLTQYIMARLKEEGVTPASLLDTDKHGLQEMRELTNSGLADFLKDIERIIHKYEKNDPMLLKFSEAALNALIETGVLSEYIKVFESNERMWRHEDLTRLMENTYKEYNLDATQEAMESVPSHIGGV